MNINKKVLEIEVSDIRKIAESLSGRNDVINMTIGEPDLDIPNEIKESLAHHALNTRIKYAPLGGLLDLREAITDYYNRTFE
ncbi:MAG: aminotransferase class I/II-fold pyridoxal phosphate-dependent enzyme, partial [Leptotrichiaceae bacterium]